MKANKGAAPIFGAEIMEAKTIKAPQKPPLQSHHGTEPIFKIEGQGKFEDRLKTTSKKIPTIKEVIAANIGLPETFARLALTVA